MQRTRGFWIVVILGSGAAACASDRSVSPSATPPPPISGAAPVRVLMLTATAGFRHDSIAAAREAMMAAGELTVTATEDLAAVTPPTLAAHDVLMFALTSGDWRSPPNQKAAIVDFVSGGGGFVGVHSASDTLYEWPIWPAGRRVFQGPSLDPAGLADRRRTDRIRPPRVWAIAFPSWRSSTRSGRTPAPRAGGGAARRRLGGMRPETIRSRGRIIRQRARLLQCARPLPGDLARPAVPAADGRRHPVGCEAWAMNSDGVSGFRSTSRSFP